MNEYTINKYKSVGQIELHKKGWATGDGTEWLVACYLLGGLDEVMSVEAVAGKKIGPGQVDGNEVVSSRIIGAVEQEAA
jgi:hypothetical protein